MKKSFFYFICLFSAVNLFAFNPKETDDLNHQGKHQENLIYLKKALEEDKTNPAIIWRLSRTFFEIGESIPNSQKALKISTYQEGMNVTKPHLDTKNGSVYDRASIVFYYTVNLGQKSKTVGIKESLDQLPEIRGYADKTLAIDPTFSLAYLLKAKIDEDVPSFLGGNKFMMGVYYTQSLKFDSTNVTAFSDAAHAFYNRNWNVKKKADEASKYKVKDLPAPELSDREHAAKITDQGITFYKTLTNPSDRETKQYNRLTKLKSQLSKS